MEQTKRALKRNQRNQRNQRKERTKRVIPSGAIKYRPVNRFGKAGLHALQEANENLLIGVLSDTNLCVIHAKILTIMDKDLGTVRRL
ncbi:histone H3.3 [Anaeramoeba flamelloides]|uniref:Histone H3.3 n=1 Tax=Anaeramoeba flamelloides TaxID=1746091 RepID=A0ABQ8ZDP5_9EUKA|nr:histone H3.3 [Anaeramoeba flamelloides]